MTDLLLETVKRRDYRLVFRWGCRTQNCHSPRVTIFLHRTLEEVKNFTRNTNQICGANHITKPLKQCTKCNALYSIETDICESCEPRARKKAELEIQLEQAQKNFQRAKLPDEKQGEAVVIKLLETELSLLDAE